MASSASEDNVASPSLPPDAVRTAITFVIFVHFFFLMVSIKSKTASSGLEQDLRQRAPGLTPYVQLLGMDLSYMFHLTYYDPTNFELAKETPGTFDDNDELRDLRDTEFYVEADILGPTGSVEKTILWPSADLKPGARFHRFQRLTSMAVGLIDNGNASASLDIVSGIADRIMAETQSARLQIRFRRRLLQNLMVPHNSPRFQAEKNRNPDAPENFPLVYKLEAGREPSLFEVVALRNSDGSVTVRPVEAAYTEAAPQQTTTTTRPADPASSKPIVIPTATGGLTR